MTNAEIGERIKRLRKERKLTREELGEKAGLSTKFLYEIENGKKGLSVESLLKVAGALSCSCDFILTGGENEENFETMNNLLGYFSKKQLNRIGEILKLIHEIQNEK